MSDVHLTGGCQCGAVRYAIHSQPPRPCICHCRMCQKQAGNIFGSFAGVPLTSFELTRGEIAWWQSSATAQRGFCRNCGTPLAWREPGENWLALALGSYDRPDLVKPIYVYGAEAMMPWLHEVMALNATVTGAGGPQVKADADPHYDYIRSTNHQHPDHDTTDWTPHPSEP